MWRPRTRCRPFATQRTRVALLRAARAVLAELLLSARRAEEREPVIVVEVAAPARRRPRATRRRTRRTRAQSPPASCSCGGEGSGNSVRFGNRVWSSDARSRPAASSSSVCRLAWYRSAGLPPSFRRCPPSFRRCPPSFRRCPPSFRRCPPSFRRCPPSFRRCPA